MDESIKKILFFDVETTGCTATYDDLLQKNPRKAKLWSEWQEKYKKTNEEHGLMTLNDVWVGKAGLHAEYGKVVCVSFGYYDADMQPKIQSFYGDDEKDIITKSMVVFNNANQKGWMIAGHNIERFDVPYLWKRSLELGIRPSPIISTWDKKPWETRMFDTSKVWSGGSWKESFTSLDTLSAVLDVQSPKDDLKGNMVHDAYWKQGLIEKIKTYCEGDIRATMQVTEKILNLVR